MQYSQFLITIVLQFVIGINELTFADIYYWVGNNVEGTLIIENIDYDNVMLNKGNNIYIEKQNWKVTGSYK